MKPYGFIYLTTNNINNKKYIGQRKIQNNIEDETYLGSGIALKEAIKKYGKDNFSREIIAYANTKDELDNLEEYYIAFYKATTSNDYYNIHAGGKGGSKFAGWSEERLNEYKRLKSQLTKGENNPRYGIACSDETKERISQARLNSKSTAFQSKEFLRRMSQVTSGENNGMFGKKHTKESKLKMSQNSKGKNLGNLNGNFGNVGDLAKNGKPIYGYFDKEHTQLAKSYNTVRLFLQDHNLKGHVALMRAIRENKKYKGYYWSRTKTCND